MRRLLIGSPICQKSAILEVFLSALEDLDQTDLEVSYCLIDDNTEQESIKLLGSFAQRHERVRVLASDHPMNYRCDEQTHHWTPKHREKVAQFKNLILAEARQQCYDYVLLIDSDVIVHPQTVQQLIRDDKEIIATILWTKWQAEGEERPQVWLQNNGSFYDYHTNTLQPLEDLSAQNQLFVEQLREAGIYQVGGLGACVLISHKALEKGVSFDPIYNTPFTREVYDFSVRAAVLGMTLFVDTHYPAYHIYRHSDLGGIKSYREIGQQRMQALEKIKIGEVLTKGLEALMTFAYDQPLSESFMAYFNQEEAANQWIQLHARWLCTQEAKLVSCGRVESYEIVFGENPHQVTCTVLLEVSGYLNEWSYSNRFECLCEVVQSDEGVYCISHFGVSKLLPHTVTPLVRRVREKPKLTLSMCVRNEAYHYLEQVLREISGSIDHAVIIDDGSIDQSGALCKEILGDKLTLIQNIVPKGDNQAALRYQQWQETILTDPDWILFLDADELLEEGAKEQLQEMIHQREYDTYCFRIYDFWNKEGYYREDAQWCRHKSYRPFMTRYQPNYNYTFLNSPRNDQRMPINVTGLPQVNSQIRIKHYGYARCEDRLRKYEKYVALDRGEKYRGLAYYKSFLEEAVNYVKWVEEEA